MLAEILNSIKERLLIIEVSLKCIHHCIITEEKSRKVSRTIVSLLSTF